MFCKTRKTTPATVVTLSPDLFLHAPKELNEDPARVGLAGNSGLGACATLFFASVRRAAALA